MDQLTYVPSFSFQAIAMLVIDTMDHMEVSIIRSDQIYKSIRKSPISHLKKDKYRKKH